MKPGGSSFRKGVMIKKNIYADAACAAMNLALNGLEQGVTEFLEHEPTRVKQQEHPGATTAARRGIFSFVYSSYHQKRHQDEKMDILCSTDDWQRGRIFDATFLHTLRDADGKPILSDAIIKQYFETFGDDFIINDEDLQDYKWPKITSLADNVLERLQDRRMKISTLWNAEGPRYSVDRTWEFDGAEYTTEYARELITAYRSINKMLYKLKKAFGRGLKVDHYNGSLLIEIMELLDTIVLEADATNPIMHTVGNGTH
jgi:hypothetical protein